jgi:hypothetical protein
MKSADGVSGIFIDISPIYGIISMEKHERQDKNERNKKL